MNEKILFTPYQPKRAFQEIAEEIRDAILNKRLTNGMRLPAERTLAQQFRVGRLTIREALRALETTGFVTIKKGSGGGAFVGATDPDALVSIITDNLILKGLTSEQMTEARMALECAVIVSVIDHATQDDLEPIARYLNEWEIIPLDQRDRGLSKSISFHILLAEASHNIPFIIFVRALMQWAERRLGEHGVPPEEEQQESHEFHKRLFEAIKKKDIGLAQQLMKEHIEQVGAEVAKHIKERVTGA
jgi:GntR family transcriptional repressor for pyruvate dehydrogenase complex